MLIETTNSNNTIIANDTIRFVWKKYTVVDLIVMFKKLLFKESNINLLKKVEIKYAIINTK